VETVGILMKTGEFASWSQPRNSTRRRSAGCSNGTSGFCPSTRPKKHGSLRTKSRCARFWRRGESNPRPKSPAVGRLHACPVRSSFRRRFSGTSKNDSPASLWGLTRRFQAASAGPARSNDASFRPAGRAEEARYLKLGSVGKLRVGSCLVPRRFRVVWPPACLPSTSASVETGTPPCAILGYPGGSRRVK